MAHEWHTTTDVVESWSYSTFLNNLQWVAQLRYGKAIRAQQRQEDAQMQRSLDQMKMR